MFGGGFAGTDINAAGDLGASVGGQQGNSGGYGAGAGAMYGAQEGGPDSGAQNFDPAMGAVAGASAGAEQAIAAGATSGAQTAAGINTNTTGGGSGGQIIGAIYNLFDPKARRLAKRQRSMARTQSRLQIANAQRAISMFQMDSQREQQMLSQSYSGRGLGESSIKNEGMDYFARKTALESQRLSDNLNLAHVGMALTNSQIAASYAQPYLQLVSGAANAAISML